MIRQNTAAIVVSDPAVLHTDLILLAAYPGIIMIITGDSNTNAIIAIKVARMAHMQGSEMRATLRKS